MKKYDEITEARKTLELSERASLDDIKENYRILLNKWHPDKCTEDHDHCSEMTKKIIAAYKSIRAYCYQYKFSFAEKEIEHSESAEDWWLKRFGNDPLWGK
jgi:curved DNA-binding protein CbpA